VGQNAVNGSWVTIKKIAELENKKNSRCKIEKSWIDFKAKVSKKHPDWVLEIYGKDTTITVVAEKGGINTVHFMNQ
jgi:hypothetical protein